MAFATHSLSERPDLLDQVLELDKGAWPDFLRYRDTPHWKHVFDTFAHHQILICDGSNRVAAVGYMVPLVWDGTLTDLPETLDEILVRALQTEEEGRKPNAVCALAAIVAQEYQGRGLSRMILREMRRSGRQLGCADLIIPVRPTWKARYPLIPLEEYVRWTRTDGAPFDPWLRVHWRMGASFLKVARNTLTVEAPVAQWEEWTGVPMPGSGQYVVPGALQPVAVDREADVGVYADPHVWMKHPLANAA